MSLEFPGGYSADIGKKLGTASFTMGDARRRRRRVRRAGACGDARRRWAPRSAPAPALDSGRCRLSALKDKLAPSLDLFADVAAPPDASTTARSSACARSGSPASSRRRRSPQAAAHARDAAAAVRRGPRLRDSVHRQRHRRVDQVADPRRPGRLPPRLAAARTGAHRGRRRHHAGGDRAACWKPASATGRAHRTRRSCRRSPPPRARRPARVPDRPARRDPVQHLRRPARRRRPAMPARSTSTSPTACSAASSPRAST